jgi:LuxR family maltose regulon positive regulatory protein
MPRRKRCNRDALYFSPRLEEKLKLMQCSRTTVFHAPSGYGKTTAAREFFERHLPKGASLVWHVCEEESAPTAWARFCRNIGAIDALAGDELSRIGLPDDDTKGDAAFTLRGLECEEDAWFVMDDFHNILDSTPHSVWKALIDHGGQKFHAVLLTQRLDGLASAATKNGILHIGADDLKLTEAETGEYFSRAGAALTPDELSSVHRLADGWIVVLYLQMLRFADRGAFSDAGDASIGTLIEEIVWNKLSDDERDFLLRISPFDGCAFDQAAFMLGSPTLPEYAIHILTRNAFFRKDYGDSGEHPSPSKTFYRPHATLLGFMRREFERLPPADGRSILCRAGEFFASIGRPDKAMPFFYKLRDFKKILSLDLLGHEFEDAAGREYSDVFLDVLESLDAETLMKHPVNTVKMIFCLFGAGRYDEFGRWCAKMEEITRNSSLGEKERNQVFGEIEIMKSFTEYNDIARMGERLKNARRMLEDRQSLISMNDAWTFGNASVLFMYHSEAGRLDGELADMREGCAHYCALTGGHGYGGDVLMEAEAMWGRGDVSASRAEAEKARFMARGRGQSCVEIGALLLMGRIAILNGDAGEFRSSLEGIDEAALRNPLKSNRMEASLASADLALTLGRPADIAEWLERGDIGEHRIYAMSIPYAQILWGKSRIMNGRPGAWLGIEGAALEASSKLRCLMAEIYGSILSAAALDMNEESDKAAFAFEKALSLAIADRLYMPFAENGAWLGNFLNRARNRDAAKKILAIHERMEAGRAAILSELYGNAGEAAHYGLTEREYEIGLLASNRLGNGEIAKKLFIAEHTVKWHMRLIFRKLRVKKREELAEFFQKQ